MERLTATFEGEKMTLADAFRYLRNSDESYERFSIMVERENIKALAQQINRRDCYPDHDEITGMVMRICGVYGYGFDVYLGESTYEIDCENGATEIEVVLLRTDSIRFSLESPAPLPPIPEKLEVKTSVIVSSLTMDELADIVSTYDEIHADAIKELNNRLDTFRDKL
ncbi:hypothetical protein LOFGKLJC_00170 [Klebsiella phage vB_KaS-Benoit]|uniref:Uncharacterized protein n=1 Tax=Klebsiella phage vB_KppS-Totoro TaxID=2762825 RepID=A0A7R8MLV8_9CAUD|nr:hypothetical protein LOFGKLJC_00170 [Klebsiella phage vB_KaS-Benoit]CAD5240074.1 hypothetical protein DEKLJIHN_00170 [Klebsiella phage vB_KppS-Jiji]CAD5240198.1 hypothetical protein JCEELMIN_00170 [Klebsiella phage vB_KppS-Totoro]CAD5240348.1 hypothetical protein GOJODADO_00170 [Klebsiella phage vB_KppS-Ponyo]